MKLRTFGITASIAATLAAGALALWIGARPGSVYTDGASIREPASTAPVRRILWQPAARLPAPLNTGSDEYEPHLSPDGRTLLLVRGRPGESEGGTGADIFTSELTPEGWSEPRPIAEINTDADELGPAMSADGRTIYFYSDRSGGLGGYDL